MTTKYIVLKILEKLCPKKNKEFINKDTQDAVVYSVRTSADIIYLECYSPVWGDLKDIHLSPAFTYEEICRKDIVTLRRQETKTPGVYVYDVVANKTANQIKQRGNGSVGCGMIIRNFFAHREIQR